MLRTPIPNDDERRQWPRYLATPSLALSVEVDGEPHACTLENLSLGGACLSFPECDTPAEGKLKLRLQDIGVIRLQRRWTDGRLLGVLFDYSDASLAFVQDCLTRMMTANGPVLETSP